MAVTQIHVVTDPQVFIDTDGCSSTDCVTRNDLWDFDALLDDKYYTLHITTAEILDILGKQFLIDANLSSFEGVSAGFMAMVGHLCGCPEISTIDAFEISEQIELKPEQGGMDNAAIACLEAAVECTFATTSDIPGFNPQDAFMERWVRRKF